MATELGVIAAGNRVRVAFDAIDAAGGADEAALAATISTLAGIGGAAVDPAEDTDHWARTAGFLVGTPQSFGEAEALVALTPSAGNLAIDGAAFWYGACTITAALDFNTVTGLNERPRFVYVTASGATRTVTASGFDSKGRVGTSGVALADGTTGAFVMWSDGTSDHIDFVGVSTDPWTPTAGGILAYDSNRLRTLLLEATAANVWALATTMNVVSTETIKLAVAPVALSVSSNNITVDGSLFINGTATISGTATFSAPTNLDMQDRTVLVTASGGDRAISANATYRTRNFGSGVTIPSGKTGLFVIRYDGTDEWCCFSGLED